MCDRALEELFDDVESELVRFPFKNKPWVSQHPSLFVTDILYYCELTLRVVGKVPSDRAGTTHPPDPGNELLLSYDCVRIDYTGQGNTTVLGSSMFTTEGNGFYTSLVPRVKNPTISVHVCLFSVSNASFTTTMTTLPHPLLQPTPLVCRRIRSLYRLMTPCYLLPGTSYLVPICTQNTTNAHRWSTCCTMCRTGIIVKLYDSSFPPSSSAFPFSHSPRHIITLTPNNILVRYILILLVSYTELSKKRR